MRRRAGGAAGLGAAVVAGACAHTGPTGVARPAPAGHPADRAVSALHAAASAADGDRYFALFAPEAVFLGTDPDERWTLAQFRAFAEPYFADGRGWTYDEVERTTYVAADGATAWFDEALHNERYGACRGTGVLTRRPGDGAWAIEQYHLTIPVPNELALDLVEMIRASDR